MKFSNAMFDVDEAQDKLFEEEVYDRKAFLVKRHDELREKKARSLYRRKVFGLVGFVIILVSILLKFFITDFMMNTTITIGGIVYGTLIVFLAIFIGDKDGDYQIHDVEDELDILLSKDMTLEEKANKKFKLHQKELKRYYDQSLKHSSMIFFVGIGAMGIGLTVVGITVYVISRTNIESTSIIIAILGGISGVLANYIGVIYLKMYSSTNQSITDFHNRLVNTHKIHFSNFFASKITNDIEREKAYFDLAMKVIEDSNGK